MREITLKQKPTEVLKVNIGDESYSIPLAPSLPFNDAREISKLKDKTQSEQLDFVMNFFARYIPVEIMNTISSADLIDLFQAWSSASDEAKGASLGES